MISYLKDSTFAIRSLVFHAWKVTKENYFSIATLSFLVFLTTSTSTFMAFFMEELSVGIRIVMFILFILSYCIVELCLIKYIFKLLDSENTTNKEVKNNDLLIIETLPTRNEIIRFLIATVYFGLSIFLVAVILMPVLFVLDVILKSLTQQGLISNYQEAGTYIVNTAVVLGVGIIFFTFIRIIFFPFFIIDNKSTPFESIKLSLATTKGNLMRLFFIFFGLILVQLVVYGFFNIVFLMGAKLVNLLLDYDINQYSSLLVVVFSSFVVVPFTTAFFAVAYRDIMKDYKGSEHPDIIHNIV